MKRIIVATSLLLVLLVGCSPKAKETIEERPNDQMVNSKNNDSTIRIQQLNTHADSFHFAVDWLTATDIVYVEKDDEHYFVKTFNTTTGHVELLHEDEAIIVDVFVHPSKRTLLLHTTTDSSSAVVKIISLEGKILDEISIASSELSIEWNKMDPTRVLFTAFYEDWSYDVFLYNGASNELNVLTMESPFPKWLGTEEIVFMKEQELFALHYKTGQYKRMEFGEVIFFDTYEDSLLMMQANGEGKAQIQISNGEGNVLSRWEMPIALQYGEWLFPNISWLSNDSVVIAATREGGELHEASAQFNLMYVKGDEQRVLVEEIEGAPLRCTADGEKCLSGFNKDKMIDVTTSETIEWVVYK